MDSAVVGERAEVLMYLERCQSYVDRASVILGADCDAIRYFAEIGEQRLRTLADEIRHGTENQGSRLRVLGEVLLSIAGEATDAEALSDAIFHLVSQYEHRVRQLDLACSSESGRFSL